MIISGRTQMLSHKYSITQIFDKYQELGFGGIELCFEDLNFNLRPDLLEDYTINHIRELVEKTKLSISAVGNHLRYLYDDYMYEYIKKSIAKTRLFGTDIFILSAMIDPFKKAAGNGLWDILVNRIKGFVEVAEEYGVKLAIEPEPMSMITDTQDFIRLCNDINSDSLACNFDIGHSFLTDDSIIKSIELIKDKIVHCHIEDMKRGEHIHLVPGRGDIDLKSVLIKLDMTGFDGGLSLDLYHYKYDEVAGEALKTIHDILRTI